MKRRILSVILSLAMVLTMMPVTVWAADEMEAVEYRACDANGRNWETATCNDYTVVDSNTTRWNTGWYVVIGEVAISTRIEVSGSVHLILTDGCALTASAGIHVSGSNALTIYGQSGSTGALSATGGALTSGIGSNSRENSAGTITINGGTVKATAPASTGDPECEWRGIFGNRSQGYRCRYLHRSIQSSRQRAAI